MDLKEISSLAEMMIELEHDIEKKETELSSIKERYRVVKEETIPCAMQEIGLESITLTTGEKLTVQQEVYASIPVANRAEAYDWLDEHGFGGLIKTSIEAAFDRGEAERAAEILQLLQEHGVSAAMAQTVHAQTLKAFIKEQLAAGTDIPLDLFGARPTMTTKIKAAKK